jgi:hypothetical protein
VRSLNAWIAIGACAALVLSGCSDSTAGTAHPTDPTATNDGGLSEPDSPTSTTKPSSSRANPSPLDGIDPCALLSDSDRTSLGLRAGEPRKVGRSEGCDWLQSGVWGVAIGLRADLAFKDTDLRGAVAHPADIGRHEAYRVENAGGGRGACEVFVITGESSFAQVTVTYGVDTAKACERALSVAKIVDPKLP